MLISTHPYFLEFIRPFKLALGERKGTDLVFIKVQLEEFIGWGEASLPPYRKETVHTVESFIKNHSNFDFHNEISIDEFLDIPFSEENPAASAALEMAVLDIFSQIKQKPIHSLLNFGSSTSTPQLTLTITKNDFPFLGEKLLLAENFHSLKLKLTGEEDDLEFVKAIRKKTDLPFCLDCNQGYDDKNKAINLIDKLEKLNCLLMEQPMKSHQHDEHYWLKQRTTFPIIGDESIQNLNDLKQFHEAYTGANIKLMKCGGLFRAYEMLQFCNEKKLLKLIGCMSESSLGVSAASVLVPYCDFADLDAPYLNRNDPFEGFDIHHHIIHTKFHQGFGVERKIDFK